MFRILLIVAMTAYVLYRLSLTVAGIKADRAGQPERADLMRKRAFGVHVGSVGALLVALVILVVLALH